MTLPTCVDCWRFELQVDGEGLVSSWCAEWSEPLDDETQAPECPEFEWVDA